MLLVPKTDIVFLQSKLGDRTLLQLTNPGEDEHIASFAGAIRPEA